jgi:hypothetical protein
MYDRFAFPALALTAIDKNLSAPNTGATFRSEPQTKGGGPHNTTVGRVRAFGYSDLLAKPSHPCNPTLTRPLLSKDETNCRMMSSNQTVGKRGDWEFRRVKENGEGTIAGDGGSAVEIVPRCS